MDTDEAEEVAFDKLEPRYRAEIIDCYERFLKFSKAMKKDPLHKKITDTANDYEMKMNLMRMTL